MKNKIFITVAILLSMILLLSLFSCGNKKQSEDVTETKFSAVLESDVEGVAENYEEITLVEIPLEE